MIIIDPHVGCQLPFAGWLDRVGLSPNDAIWVPNNGAAPSLQELIAGGVDAVCCSLPEAQSLLDSGRVRCLGAMAGQRLDKFPDVPTFKEQGVDWTLTGWRGVCVPKGTPPDVTARIAGALEEVATSDIFHTFMGNAGFDVTWQPGTRWAERITTRLAMWGSDDVEVSYEPFLTFQMSGIGYRHPVWNHGCWVGNDESTRDEIVLADVNPLDPLMLHVQALSRATWGERTGVGVVEQLIIGPHEPTGLTGIVDGAA